MYYFNFDEAVFKNIIKIPSTTIVNVVIVFRDNRYHQVVHMVTSAKGAEQFYSIEDHATRKEGLDEARDRDTRAAEAWIGHPYVDIIDNSSDFETKINRLISCVAVKMGIDVGDRLKVSRQFFMVYSALMLGY